MKNTRWLPAAFCSVAFFNVALADPTFGELLYSDPFNTESANKDSVQQGDWYIVNEGINRLVNWDPNLEEWQVDFGWDYSDLGIPPAPSGEDGETRGLRLSANRYPNIPDGTSGTSYALTVILKEEDSSGANMFTGDYAVTFDMWVNYNGPLGPDETDLTRGVGGPGSTHFATFGVGLDQFATHPQRYQPVFNPDFNENPSKGAWFAIAFEGQNLFDFRVHKGSVGQRADSGQFYAADTQASAGVLDARDARQPYYAEVMPGVVAAPPEQLAMWSAQIGRTPPGTPAFAWNTVTIKRRGGLTDPEFPYLGTFATVTWEINGKPIVTLDPRKGSNDANGDNADLANFTTEGRIFLGVYDFIASIVDNPDAHFVLYDNLRVYELLPELEGGYDVWAEQLPSGDRGRDADPDGDGIRNLVEYALGLNPQSADVAGLPVGAVEDGFLTLNVSKNAEALGIDYVVEVSGDLVNWESGAGFTTELENTDSVLRIRDNAEWTGADRRFIRLRVVETN